MVLPKSFARFPKSVDALIDFNYCKEMLDVPTPITNAENEVEDIRDLIRQFIEDTGQTATEIAERASVPRDFLYRFLSGSYRHSPKFEDVCRLMDAIGYEMVPRKK